MEHRYPVADLTSSVSMAMRPTTEVEPSALAAQLQQIRDAIGPTLVEAPAARAAGLKRVEIGLTIGAEGGVWFIAKGSAEASIKMTFEVPSES